MCELTLDQKARRTSLWAYLVMIVFIGQSLAYGAHVSALPSESNTALQQTVSICHTNHEGMQDSYSSVADANSARDDSANSQSCCEADCQMMSCHPMSGVVPSQLTIAAFLLTSFYPSALIDPPSRLASVHFRPPITA